MFILSICITTLHACNVASTFDPAVTWLSYELAKHASYGQENPSITRQNFPAQVVQFFKIHKIPHDIPITFESFVKATHFTPIALHNRTKFCLSITPNDKSELSSYSIVKKAFEKIYDQHTIAEIDALMQMTWDAALSESMEDPENPNPILYLTPQIKDPVTELCLENISETLTNLFLNIITQEHINILCSSIQQIINITSHARAVFIEQSCYPSIMYHHPENCKMIRAQFRQDLEDTVESRRFLKSIFGTHALTSFLKTHNWEDLSTEKGFLELYEHASERLQQRLIRIGQKNKENLFAWEQIQDDAIKSIEEPKAQEFFRQSICLAHYHMLNNQEEYSSTTYYDVLMILFISFAWDALNGTNASAWIHSGPQFLAEFFTTSLSCQPTPKNGQHTPKFLQDLRQEILDASHDISENRPLFLVQARNNILEFFPFCWAMDHNAGVIGSAFKYPINKKKLSVHNGLFSDMLGLTTHDLKHNHKTSHSKFPSHIFEPEDIAKTVQKDQKRVPYYMLILKAIIHNQEDNHDEDLYHYLERFSLPIQPLPKSAAIESLIESCQPWLDKHLGRDMQAVTLGFHKEHFHRLYRENAGARVACEKTLHEHQRLKEIQKGLQ